MKRGDTSKAHSDKPAGAPKAASLATIAKHLGLSPASISRVLSGAPAARSIPKATQDRILAAAKQLNYRPNVLARSLRHGRSMMIGVLVPEVSEGYVTQVVAGIEQVLLQAGYIFFFVSHHHRPEIVDRALTMFRERAVDGMIAVDTTLPDFVALPAVSVSGPDGHTGSINIALNHQRSADLVVNHLKGLGHKKIAVIRGQAFSSDSGPRWEAVRNAVRNAGLRVQPRLVAQLEDDAPTHEPGYFAAQALLAEGIPFTALVAFNDISAIGAVRAFRESGLRVPQDVSVVGFDDVPSAAFQNPPLTTVRQPLKMMGILAAETLLRIIADKTSNSPAKRLVVDPELIVRDSTCSALATRT